MFESWLKRFKSGMCLIVMWFVMYPVLPVSSIWFIFFLTFIKQNLNLSSILLCIFTLVSFGNVDFNFLMTSHTFRHDQAASKNNSSLSASFRANVVVAVWQGSRPVQSKHDLSKMCARNPFRITALTPCVKL